ncbi:hypothetical protein Baya_7869 [Bagarius yarrelli]|uniref:Uncharacterized protein n=1 Tax=Bagarius yarrelli TaxID=175774 RepID=A0A556U331_BAGYA|nr:hypothetical protein Baya_7869 [Bagarius yarrelli]
MKNCKLFVHPCARDYKSETPTIQLTLFTSIEHESKAAAGVVKSNNLQESLRESNGKLKDGPALAYGIEIPEREDKKHSGRNRNSHEMKGLRIEIGILSGSSSDLKLDDDSV